MPRLPRTLLFFLAVTTLSTVGCRHTAGETAAAVPAIERPGDNGLLLRTGSIQLGPGLTNNAYGWLGDSRGGLLSPE